MFATTSLGVTTVGTVLVISANSTWADISDVLDQDIASLAIANTGSVDVRLCGSDSTVSGYPFKAGREIVLNITRRTDAVRAWTTSGTTGTLDLMVSVR